MPPKSLPTSSKSRALAAGAVLAAVVLAFGLVKVLASGESGSRASGQEQPGTRLFSDKPLWDERRIGMAQVAGIALRGGTAIVAGTTGDGDGARLAVVDVRTGEPRWVVDAGATLKGGDGATTYGGAGSRAAGLRGVRGSPLVYGDGEDWTVLVQYAEESRGDKTEIGVAALSGKDGAVRWKHALFRHGSGDLSHGDRRVRALAADERAVLTSVEGEKATDPKTVALDPATGKKIWENDAGWAYRFAGGLVLGETRGDQAPATEWGGPRNGTDVFALDVRTGEKRWDLSDEFGSSHLDAVAGPTAVIKVAVDPEGKYYPRTLLLDTATGRAGAEIADFRDCEDDARMLIVCSGTRELATIRSGAGAKPVPAKKAPFEDAVPEINLIRQGRIFVTRRHGGNGLESVVVDRAGNRLGRPPAGVAAAVSERAAAFLVPRAGSSPGRPEGLVVHAAAAGAKPSGPGEPTLEPPRIDAAPLWAAGAGGTPAPSPAEAIGLTSFTHIDLAGDALIYTGEDRDDQDKLVVADAMTGAERWSIREDASLGAGAEAKFLTDFHIVDVDGERLLIIPYLAPGDEQGFAALSVEDGAVRWKKRVPTGDGTAILEAADATTLAVEVEDHDGGEDVRDETIVYATGSRRELWRKRGVEPAGVGGGLVLTTESARGAGGVRKRTDLIAYGVSDGERRWRLGDRYPEPELLHDAGGETIVIGTADGGAVLDRATGRELARTHTPLVRCDGDADTLIVCESGPDGPGTDPESRAVTIRTRDGKTEIRDLLETGFLTRYGAVGNWFVAVRPAGGSGSGGEPERFLALDVEGRQVSDDLPGLPIEIGGGLAVLVPSEMSHSLGNVERPGFTVHRFQG